MLRAISETDAVKALAHITGGGLSENLPRILAPGLAAHIDLAALDVPPVFGWLAHTASVAPDELLRTFNLGAGMVIVCAQSQADALIEVLKDAGETPRLIGALEQTDGEPRSLYDGALRLD